MRYGYSGITVVGVFRLDTPVIEGNTLRDCEYGIWSRDSNAWIVGNTIVGNTKAGVYFDGFSQSLMQSNRIISNGKYGVEDRTDFILQSPCLNCTWTKETANDVYGNGLYDVYFLEETGMAWPGTYSCMFTSCGDLTIGDIVNPGDGVSHTWLSWRSADIAIPRWAWITEPDSALVCVVNHPLGYAIIILDCSDGLGEIKNLFQ